MRRRRQKSTWFPVLGTDAGEGNPLSSVYSLTQLVDLNYQTTFEVTPLIPDYTEDPSTSTSEQTLRDFVEGQTCIIDRIVGKIFVNVGQVAGSGAGFTTPNLIIAAAGIAVLPVDDAGVAITTGAGEEINPLYAENLDKPWYWRRTWLLGNQASFPPSSPYYAPQNNLGLSVADGPHIDTKGVKRAIQRNQRIFLILANRDASPGEPNEVTDLRWNVDLRVLGRMRKAKNRSVFT